MLTGVEDDYNLEVTSRLARTKLAPLYFVRSGLVYLISAGTFRVAGISGAWWSSRGADNIWGSAGLGGYYLYFGATGVGPSDGPDNRYYGFSLRCLSTLLDM